MKLLSLAQTEKATAEEDLCRSMEAYPMIGGVGKHSYSKNSTHQKQAVEYAKEHVKEAILEGLEVKNSNSSKPHPTIFTIVDFGCSTGPNTFLAVQNIVDAVKYKYKTLGLESETPEFQVFFNDHTTNDFNTLFASLPSERQFYAAGVPGSFYKKVFPNGSIDIAHSSYSIHWLSKIPEEVLDKRSEAWNGGRIHYGNAPDPVIKAYEAQFEKDVNSFLHFRAQEMVRGGSMILSLPGRYNGTRHSESTHNMYYAALGSCIMDLVTKGVLDEETASTFNLPVYTTCANELAELINKNGCFGSQEIKELPVAVRNPPSYEFVSSVFRAILENVIQAHFGESINMDELFDLFSEKIKGSPYISEKKNLSNIFVVIKSK